MSCSPAELLPALHLVELLDQVRTDPAELLELLEVIELFNQVRDEQLGEARELPGLAGSGESWITETG